MKTAAEEAAEVIVHYLQMAARNRNLDDFVLIFSEIEGVMQGMIDEAVKRALAEGPPQLFNEPVQGGSCTPPIEVPDAPAPLGPVCTRPEPALRHGRSEQAPKIAGVQQLLPGSMCLQPDEELEHLSSDRQSHIYNCRFCEQVMMERGE